MFIEQNNNNFCHFHSMEVDGDQALSSFITLKEGNMCIFRLKTILEIYGRKELLVVINFPHIKQLYDFRRL